ncbi:ATP-binding protein [Agrobacterium tumefaciens]|uniref:ATP-binding protein n=1 Tax=Agrobacterium tumefaciens TaxID=358 RepID=UPI0015722544|nr:ATP-binding protein [Agrobacterium tumefaciens]NTE35233.1 AAA family ATPase [Agrobacterium tumefaciens]NTE50743.1 AAA family ATPase [Agrobacterium tumefaciens]
MTNNNQNDTVSKVSTSIDTATPDKAAEPRFHTEAFETDESRMAASRLPVSRRQWMIKNLIVKYPVFNEGYGIIAENHYPVAGGTHATGTVGAMLGESRTGKTAVCSYYSAMHPATYDDDGEIFPVIHLTASINMSPMEFAHELNRLTAARYARMHGGVGAYVNNALLRLLKVRTQLLIVDDAQYLFFERTSKTAANMFKLIKTIVDYNTMSVMLVGEERVNDYVNSIDAFVNRGYNSHVLRPLTSGKSDMKRFEKLLGAIDKRLPFANLSGFEDPYIAQQMYRYSDGMIGRVMNLVRPAAFKAMNQGTSRIMIEHLREAVVTRRRKGDTHDYFGGMRDAA